MSMYQECRPRDLDGIVGNPSTVSALKNMIKQEPKDRPHAILIKGPTGCGKTTLARILASSFGSIDQSITENNAANLRGIDTVREIASDCRLMGIGGTTRTYIFDECHQLTRDAQEALLKVLEDNPPHCYFILCTTEPNNIIKTIRNRCAEYEVSPLSKAEIESLLRNICKEKGLKDVSNDILEAIALTCDGSPRTAIVSLEQIIGLKVDDALELLVKGTDKDQNVIDLCKLLIMTPDLREKKWKQILNTLGKINEDSETVRKSILTFLFNKLVKCEQIEDAKDITKLLGIFSMSTFYGGKSQLGALVVRACLEE